ncbi:universal stress protein [Halobaculum litoreum]|uniref:universal stress protein n=1 Tax=Halobaculum litoreum TaxID=3031998 RepID=UPI0024C3EC20|nr:universal stress protein [Halobaculum sp. DT92]
MLYVVATNSTERSEALCDYLEGRLGDDDTVHAINSQRGGDHTSRAQLERGTEALAVVNERLSGVADVETHQLVRGNAPAADVLAFVDRYGADEIVIGVRKRTPDSKTLLGSVARDILLDSTVPIRVVPVSGGR